MLKRNKQSLEKNYDKRMVSDTPVLWNTSTWVVMCNINSQWLKLCCRLILITTIAFLLWKYHLASEGLFFPRQISLTVRISYIIYYNPTFLYTVGWIKSQNAVFSERKSKFAHIFNIRVLDGWDCSLVLCISPS